MPSLCGMLKISPRIPDGGVPLSLSGFSFFLFWTLFSLGSSVQDLFSPEALLGVTEGHERREQVQRGEALLRPYSWLSTLPSIGGLTGKSVGVTEIA